MADCNKGQGSSILAATATRRNLLLASTLPLFAASPARAQTARTR